MKPSLSSTAFAFVILGAIGLVMGLVGFPQPLVILGGAVAAVAGLGLFFRLRIAWLLAAGHALVHLGISGVRVYSIVRGGEGSIVMPAVWVAVSLYLLVSLVAIRAEFKK